jgi:hypothetical protein
LDELYSITTELSNKGIESSAEKLLSLAEGKPREAWTGVTFQQLKELLTKIIKSKYFNIDTTTTVTTTQTETKGIHFEYKGFHLKYFK